MPYLIQGNPRLEVGRDLSDEACPTCGHRHMVWRWWVWDKGLGGPATRGEAPTKAAAIDAGRKYAQECIPA